MVSFRWFIYLLLLLPAFVSCTSDTNKKSVAKNHFDVGNELIFKEDFVKGQKEYEEAVKADTGYWQAYYSLGTTCAIQGDLQNAQYYLTRCIALNPNFAYAYCQRANIEELSGNERAYIKDINKAVSLKKDLFTAILSKCRLEYAKGNFKDAINDLDDLISIRADYYMAYNLRGTSKYKIGDFDGAIADFNRELNIRQGDLTAIMNRGVAYGELKNYKAAIADMNVVIAQDPKVSQAYLFKGLYQYKLNIKDSARINFTIAGKLKNPQAKAYLKEYYGK